MNIESIEVFTDRIMDGLYRVWIDDKIELDITDTGNVEGIRNRIPIDWYYSQYIDINP